MHTFNKDSLKWQARISLRDAACRVSARGETGQAPSLQRISHALALLSTVKKFPWHIRQAFACGLADSVRVLGIETDLAILVDNLRMQGEDHVLFERNIGLRADCGILQHGHPDAMTGEMAECEAVFGKYV